MEATRNSLDQFAAGLGMFVIKFRWLVIIASLVGAGYIGTGAQHLTFNNNYRVFFSEENPELRAFEEFQATYTKTDNFLFAVVTKDGSSVFSNETLQAVHEITEAGWLLPYAQRVDSITNFQHTYAIGDELIVEDLVISPGQSTEEEIARSQANANAEPLLKGALLSESGAATIIAVTLQYPEQSLTEVPEAVAGARALQADIQAAYPDLEVYLTGISMLNQTFSESARRDFGGLVPAMIIVILITTALAVRSLMATLSTLLVIILSTTIAMGWAGFSGVQFAGPSPSAAIVILTLAIADSIHILISARSGMRAGLAPRSAIIESIRINFLAVSITSLTTIVGFLSLNFSDSPPFRDLGNISAVGILAAWGLSVTLLPALLSFVPFKVKVRENTSQRSTMGILADIVIHHHRKLLVLTGLATLGLIALIPTNKLSDSFRLYFDERIAFRVETDKVAEHFGFYTIEFSLDTREPGEVSDPAFLEKLEEFSLWLRDYPDVVHVYSLTDIMKRLNKNMNADDASFYRLPDTRELSAQYLLLYELSLPYGLDLNDRVNIDKSATRVTVTFDANISSAYTRQFMSDVDQWFDENAPNLRAPATSPQVMFTYIAQRNIESMMRGTTVAILLIALIMMAALRSVRLGILSLAPNALPILCSFGAWALLVGEVGFAVSVIASISLGIVIDDTVHFLTKFRRAQNERNLSCADSIRYAFETVGVALIVNTIILTAGFMILTLSSFQVNVQMGLLTSLSIVFALILDFLLLPALLLILSRENRDKESLIRGDHDVTPTFTAAS